MSDITLNNGFKVRDMVRQLLRKEPLSKVLDKFHAKMATMSVGPQMDGDKVTLSPDISSDPVRSGDFFLSSLLRRIRFEGMFDVSVMQAAMDLGTELKERQTELFSNREFLSSFAEMLLHSKNADDLESLAGLCLGVCSVHGNNPALASIAEVSSPEIIIEMTKAVVNLVLTKPPEVVAVERPAPPPMQEAAPPAQAEEPQKEDGGGARPKKKTGEQEGIDPRERIVQEILKMPDCPPEIFVRGFLESQSRSGNGAHPPTLLRKMHKWLENIHTYAERDGIPPEFVEQCILEGAIYSRQVEDAYRKQQELEAGAASPEQQEAPQAEEGAETEQHPAIWWVPDEFIQSCKQEGLEDMDGISRKFMGRLVQSELDKERVLGWLQERLLSLGVDEGFVKDILSQKEYSEAASFALFNLNDLAARTSDGFAFVVAYRKPEQAMLRKGYRPKWLTERVKKFQADAEEMGKYADFIPFCETELKLPAEAAVFIASFITKTHINAATALENTKLLHERMPLDELRMVALTEPRALVIPKLMSVHLDKYPAPEDVHAKEMLDALLELNKTRKTVRPEAFVRNFIKHRYQLVAGKVPEKVMVHVDYWARNLQKRATENEIPRDLVQRCIEDGVVDFEEIKRRHRLSQEKDKITTLDSETAISTLGARLKEIGVDEAYINEIVTSPELCCHNPQKCLFNLESMVELYGEAAALVSIYKAKKILSTWDSGGIVEAVASEINAAESDPDLRSKYDTLLLMVVSDFSLPEGVALLVAAKAKTNRATEDRVLENMLTLKERVPGQEIRRILLTAPYKVPQTAHVNDILKQYPGTGKGPDLDKVVKKVVDLGTCNRPEEFIRSVVRENLDALANQAPERVASHVEFKARDLIGKSKKLGVSADFLEIMFESGVTEISVIEKEWTDANAMQPSPQAAMPPPQQAQPKKADPDMEKLRETLSGLSLRRELVERILSVAEGGSEARTVLSNLQYAIDFIHSYEEISPSSRAGVVREFLAKESHQRALGSSALVGLQDMLISFADESTQEAEEVPPVKSGPSKASSNVNNDVMDKIRSVPVPEDLEIIFSSRNLDPHEFCFITLKAFRWLHNKNPQVTKREKYEDALRYFSNGKLRAVTTIHNLIMTEFTAKNCPKVKLKSEGELEKDTVPWLVIRFLKQAHYAVHKQALNAVLS